MGGTRVDLIPMETAAAFFAASLVLTRSAKAQRVINRLAGTVFAALAVKLVFTER